MANVEKTGYINKKLETDLPYFAGGLLAAGFLLTAVPLCIPKTNDIGRLVRTGTALIAIGEFAVAGAWWRRIHKVLLPQWHLVDDYQNSLQEDLAKMAHSEELAREVALTKQRLQEQFDQRPEPQLQPAQAVARTTSSTSPQQLERLFYEGGDDVRKFMLENGIFNPEKRPDTAPSKDFSDSDDKRTATDGTAIPTSSTDVDGQADEQANLGEVERVRVLVELGKLKLPEAIKRVTGLDSGHRRYKAVRKAYLAKYGE